MAAGLAIVALGGCAKIHDHKGYVVDSTLIGSIQPGVDNRDSVTKTLGNPSFASEFDGGANWYYFSRNTRQYAFGNPKPVQQILLTVAFAKTGEVTSVKRTGLETIRDVSPYGKRTPTLGRRHNLLNDLFGNIGAAGGTPNAPSADNPDGG